MCSITKPSSSPHQPRRPVQALPLAMLLAALILGFLLSRSVPLIRAYLTTHISIACSMVLVLLASFVSFVNFYSGKRLRECSPMTKHLAAMSKTQSAPEDWLVDLNKVANPEGLSQLWTDQVVNDGVGFSILLTGVTGYVGRAFLFQLLREIANGEASTGRKVQHKVYVMARAKARKNLSAAQRLEKIRDDPMFVPYKKQWDEVVVAVQSGDLQDVNCGMPEETLEMLAGALITHIVHLAADVNFNRPLADSAGINIAPAVQLLALAHRWPSCKRFIHCSTAFVNPGHGSGEAPMPEKLFSLGEHDPQALYESMQGNQKLALAVKQELAFPNNYVFTKCVAEHLIVCNNQRIELKIVRPAIVGPAWALPEPGWNGDKPSTITALLLLWGTRVIRFAPLTKRPIPMIPVDVVAVGIIHAMISPTKDVGNSASDAEPKVSIRNLIWSHKSPRSCIDGMTMANICLSSAVMKHHFSSSETAVSFALIDIVYQVPQLFPILHLIFNLGPLYALQFACWISKVAGIKSVLEQVPVVKLLKFSDMLTLYKPYMGREYYFESSLDVPATLGIYQYCASLFKATHSFWTSLFPGTVEDLSVMELLPHGRMDLWWALTFPSRNFSNRIVAYLSCKILRETHVSACVDIGSLESVSEVMSGLEATASDRKHNVLLALRHESPIDDVLTKFVSFSMAALGVDVPSTLSQADFDDAKAGNTLERIRSKYDRHVTLAAKLQQDSASESFLRILVNTSDDQDYIIIPLYMDYQEHKESDLKKPGSGHGVDLRICDLLSLYWQVCVQGKHRMTFSGVKITYGEVSHVNTQSDLRTVTSKLESEHCRLSAIVSARGVAADGQKISPSEPPRVVKTQLLIPGGSNPSVRDVDKPWVPSFTPYLNKSHPTWASYVAGGRIGADTSTTLQQHGEIEAVLKTIDAAYYLAIRAKISLYQKQVENPTTEDIVKEMDSLDGKLRQAACSFIFETAASIAVRNSLSSLTEACYEEKEC